MWTVKTGSEDSLDSGHGATTNVRMKIGVGSYAMLDKTPEWATAQIEQSWPTVLESSE